MIDANYLRGERGPKYTVAMSPSKVIVSDIVTQVLDNPSTVVRLSRL